MAFDILDHFWSWQHLLNRLGPVFLFQKKSKESEMEPVQPIQNTDASSDVPLVSGDAHVCKHFKFGFCKFGEKCRKQHLKETCQTYDCQVKTCNKRHPRICKYFSVNQICKFGDTCCYKHKLSTHHCNILEQVSSLHATISSLSESIQALENEILKLQGSLPPPERKREDPAASISSPTATKPVTPIISKVTWHESPATALFSPGNGNEEPDFTDEAMEVDVPSNYIPSPPVCSSCKRRGDWTLSRIDTQRAWHHLYKCCGKHAKICTPPDFAQFVIPEW